MENQSNKKRILVTGGLGFIGSYFVELALKRGYHIINVDKKTYAMRKDLDFDKRQNYELIEKDICDLKKLPENISYIVNFAAESHVDNSIKNNFPFFKSNVQGVYNLLELVRVTENSKRPIFVQISTDEVYGDIEEGSFKETDLLHPSSPYSATKAAADELILGWTRTHGLKTMICRSANNYGYGQFAEKLIPKAMKMAFKGQKIGLHGSGLYKREWIYAGDNCEAIMLVMEKGVHGEIYNISSNIELTNIDIVKKVMKVMGRPENFFEFVEDRPGQDIRYSIDTTKIRALGWSPKTDLSEYLIVCEKLNEVRRARLPLGKKRRILKLVGLERFLKR